ncbi:MAG TPA: hypothetical protein PKC68_00215 [Alphaproteobacteria bacterium]|nr:hypothetical protein [Alphaproteobacteria bacterium]
MRQVNATEIQDCLDEYLINIDRDPLQVKTYGVGCPDAVIISEDEFSRLKHAENSLLTIGTLLKKLLVNKVVK